MTFASEPTDLELADILNLGKLLEWAGLSDIAPTATTTVLLSARAAFLNWADMGPQTHFRSLATMSVQDFKQQLNGWTVNSHPPSFGAMSAVILAHQTARYMCKHEVWPSEAATIQTQQAAIAAAAPPANNQQLPVANTVNLPTIKVGHVLDQKLGEEITYMPPQDAQLMYARYIKVMDEAPGEDVAVTIEQLTAISHVLRSGRAPYADFSIWVKNANRMMKRIALQGLVFDSKGALHNVEMYGPPTLEAWAESYDCLVTSMIMLNTVSRPNLANYRKHIHRLSAQFGPKVWHLLYQCDVRCRQELMEASRMKLQEQHNTALAQNRVSTFDPKRPWDSVWEDVISSNMATKWWRDNFETPGFMILTHTKSLESMIDSDAPVDNGHGAGSYRPSPPPGFSVTAAHPGARRPKAPKKPKPVYAPQQQGTDGSMASNRKGRRLCPGFQDGSCTDTVGTATCGKDRSMTHQCAKCLSQGHGANYPSPCQRNQVSPNDSGKGKFGKGKKGGKGKGFGKRW